MSDLRQAAQAALDALEEVHRTGDTQWFDLYRAKEVINDLRAALAEPTPVKDEPVAWQWLDSEHFRKHLPNGKISAEWRPLYLAAPASQETPRIPAGGEHE